jgi:alanyl-tRNA synthetase
VTPEEYQRLKEAEKAHLRSLRELKKAVRSASRQTRLADAIEGATARPMQALDDHDALIQDLAIETARNEARLDVALESVSGAQDAEIVAENEEVLRKARAAELVRQLRGQMEAGSSGSDSTTTPAAQEETTTTEGPGLPLPEKTIGRMKP